MVASGINISRLEIGHGFKHSFIGNQFLTSSYWSSTRGEGSFYFTLADTAEKFLGSSRGAYTGMLMKDGWGGMAGTSQRIINLESSIGEGAGVISKTFQPLDVVVPMNFAREDFNETGDTLDNLENANRILYAQKGIGLRASSVGTNANLLGRVLFCTFAGANSRGNLGYGTGAVSYRFRANFPFWVEDTKRLARQSTGNAIIPLGGSYTPKIWWIELNANTTNATIGITAPNGSTASVLYDETLKENTDQDTIIFMSFPYDNVYAKTTSSAPTTISHLDNNVITEYGGWRGHNYIPYLYAGTYSFSIATTGSGSAAQIYYAHTYPTATGLR